MGLTDEAIRVTQTGSKPYKMYDGEGLFLLVNPSRVETLALALSLRR